MKRIIALICVLFVTACAMGPMIRQSEEAVPIALEESDSSFINYINAVYRNSDDKKMVPEYIIWQGRKLEYSYSYYGNKDGIGPGNDIPGDDAFESRFDFFAGKEDIFQIVSANGKFWGYRWYRYVDKKWGLHALYVMNDRGVMELVLKNEIRAAPVWVGKYSRTLAEDFNDSLPKPGDKKEMLYLQILSKRDKRQRKLLENDKGKFIPSQFKLNEVIYGYVGSSYIPVAQGIMRRDIYLGPYIGGGPRIGGGFAIVGVLSTNEKIWGYGIIRNADNMSPDNVTYIDFNGDGIFGMKIPVSVEVLPPLWTR